ncbi:CRISPR-associated endonuclease Cas2 [Okeania sp. SIO1I7]|nr:CRISPR-associated endonuclease Cas2 [Okeania sp. SIO1I7]
MLEICLFFSVYFWEIIFMYVVVCYDISDDKRRTKIHNILKSYWSVDAV